MNDSFHKSYVHPSGNLSLRLHSQPTFVEATYRDLATISKSEYMNFLKLTGDFMVEGRTGRLLANFRSLESFPLNLRAIAINNFKPLISDRVPFLLVAIVKRKHVVDDFAIELALEVARPLSKTFLDGQIFTDLKEGLEWLVDYPVANDLQ
jgi:hypothetical protein